TPGTPAAVTTCGTSSAAAATTAARPATASTGGSTSLRRAAGAVGPRGSCPRCSGRPTEAPCSRSRCRSSQNLGYHEEVRRGRLPRQPALTSFLGCRSKHEDRMICPLLILGVTLSLDNVPQS